MLTRYHIDIGIILTVNQPESLEVIKDRIQEEISILCSRLERLERLSNNVFLHNSNVRIEKDKTS